MILELAAIGFLLGGVFFMLLAVVGLLRMPDTYLRSQTTTLAATFGKIGVVLAVACTFGDVSVTLKAALSVIFLFVTAPIGAHLIVRAAYRDRSPLSKITRTDDYASRDA
jgi:multicomponent Na+:H+ antiporter subunit G